MAPDSGGAGDAVPGERGDAAGSGTDVDGSDTDVAASDTDTPASDTVDTESPLSDVDELFWTDEILEATYWMVGEGIEDAVEPPDLRGFLDAPPGVVAAVFERLEDSGHVDHTADGFVFTDRGERAARKCFADEFGDIQGFDASHTDCGADCWCHEPEHAGDECPSDHDHSHDNGQ